jgi:hypothetical protein
MKRSLTVTLAADGSSDRCLLHPIRWAIAHCLRDSGVESVQPLFANVPAIPLADRIRCALDQYPCDLLLIHRDAEKQDPTLRRREIHDALCELREDSAGKVPVVPVRMSEAWLLISEPAIREAAANPRGRNDLVIPRLAELESVADPKAVLRTAIMTAADASGRKRDNLRRDLPKRVHRVAELIDDYSPLRALASFQQLESDLRAAIEVLLRAPAADGVKR